MSSTNPLCFDGVRNRPLDPSRHNALRSASGHYLRASFYFKVTHGCRRYIVQLSAVLRRVDSWHDNSRKTVDTI